MSYTENLSASEKMILHEAPVLVTILIAGADGEIDKAEKEEADHLIKYRAGVTGNPLLESYYAEVQRNFNSLYTSFVAKLPEGTEERSTTISNRLEMLNNILPKTSPKFAKALYDDLKDFAKHIAEASGGIKWMNFATVSEEEQMWIGLEMLVDPGAAS